MIDYSSLPADPYSPEAFVVRSPADASWVPLPVAPQLESWMATGSPDSERLRAFIEDALPRIAPFIEGRNCGLELAVRLASTVPLITGGRDLDNFLFPLIYRLGEMRSSIVSVFGTKESSGELSQIRAGLVGDERAPLSGWAFAGTEASGAAGSVVWRERVTANLAPAPEMMPPGPLDMHVAFRGARANWHQDWKSTIDGLGAILGLEPNRRFAADSRITRLALHRMRDSSLGQRTLIGVWWRPAAST